MTSSTPMNHARIGANQINVAEKSDADYIFYELTRSICPTCRRAIDARILLRTGKVHMHKRCPEHGYFEALVYGDAQAHIEQARRMASSASAAIGDDG